MEETPEKTSVWSEAEREKLSATPHAENNNCPGWIKTGRCQDPTGEHTTADPGIVMPPWLPSFMPGTFITHNGWRAAIRHVGQEEGHWLVLIEPFGEAPAVTNGQKRAALRPPEVKLVVECHPHCTLGCLESCPHCGNTTGAAVATCHKCANDSD